MGAVTIQKTRENRKSIRVWGNSFDFCQMKKIFLTLVAVIGFILNGFGQNTVVIQNDGKTTNAKDDCTYRINGICTTEDLGGVEVSTGSHKYDDANEPAMKIKFTNYNNFIVTVIFEVEVDVSRYNYGTAKRIGTIVLKPNETKETSDYFLNPTNYRLIVRKVN